MVGPLQDLNVGRPRRWTFQVAQVVSIGIRKATSVPPAPPPSPLWQQCVSCLILASLSPQGPLLPAPCILFFQL